MQGSGKGEFNKLSFEDADKFADNKLGGTCQKDGTVARMHRELEGNTSKGEVVSSGDDKANVTKATTTMSRGKACALRYLLVSQ